MLSLIPDPKKLRSARNVLPRANGAMYTRPGASQVVTGQIGRAVAWGNRVLMEKDSRLVLWDAVAEHDLGVAGLTLKAVAYQAYVGAGEQEDRLYIADGIHPLSYLHKVGGSYVRTTVVNSVLGDNSQPYPIPIPFNIAHWRERLWICDGTNQVYHSQNMKPDEFDPLWGVSFQASGPDIVYALIPMGDTLVACMGNALWGISGTSQFNWQRTELLSGLGVAGQDAAVAIGSRLLFAAASGLYELGQDAPLSEDLRRAFEAGQPHAQLVIDRTRRLLFLQLTGQVYAMHLDRAGEFTQFHGYGVQGVLATDALLGWYGEDGLWICGLEDMADFPVNGAARPVQVLLDTWDQRPNDAGSGRALLDRAFLKISGPASTAVLYKALSDEGGIFVSSTAPGQVSADIPGLPIVGEYWPYTSIRREFSPKIAGQTFRHILSAVGSIQIDDFSPVYRFGKPEDQ